MLRPAHTIPHEIYVWTPALLLIPGPGLSDWSVIAETIGWKPRIDEGNDMKRALRSERQITAQIAFLADVRLPVVALTKGCKRLTKRRYCDHCE
ncbi:MAG: hypothetical protein U5K76_04655 [Woeseiaceae bacterium]|nr:hypothetical protein [Woeseiaceae bacterium]